ncbi:MAG: hypothetical protein KKC75_03665 [Nanoarchaeota archaeon]|nr:hypothetical protein [Nanoarchaeota archaeon]MBU1005104.1 hypothetical protein [Nanoarchaeota archaeon]MBU1945432.1 hypothetical protein [Nanoarchaeota archaeon]
MKNENVLQKIKKVGEILGEKTIFTIGVDSKNQRIDLISVDICHTRGEVKKQIAQLPPAEYIG